ncbi:Protein of unknown function [Oceanobacillus limi]|uniref:Uncharacterized protein n=1 Tax=Oceanobacillus limi TaxID=930131 RepID=A0A1I0C633_9BACI|nr:YisL family protein [Oceanobacillus limi]SET14376.1 Protein of unknown function [Oceanobacillus limi]
MNTHLHITAWVLALILFAVAVMLHKQGNAKGSKIVQMILRLDYLLILYSGGDLIANYFGGDSPLMGEAIAKGIIGIWVIAAMEMTLAKIKKDKPAKGGYIQLIIAVILTFILGFVRLPGGLM